MTNDEPADRQVAKVAILRRLFAAIVGADGGPKKSNIPVGASGPRAV